LPVARELFTSNQRWWWSRSGGVKRNFWLRNFWPVIVSRLFCFSE